MRILLLSTTVGYQLRSFGESAERLGVELVLGTDRCHHLEDPWRDGALAVRFYEDDESVAAIVRAAEERPFTGVLAVGDRPAVLAARVAEALKLPGNPPAAAEASANKRRMREVFSKAGLEVPWFTTISTHADVSTVARSLHYPVVVKPIGLSGSRGVIRADSEPQFDAAVSRVRALLSRPSVRAARTGLESELLVESYIDGPEYAIEGLLTDGVLHVLALFDKPDPLEGPFFEETIYVTPPRGAPEIQGAIHDELQRSTRALGLVHGPVHAECRLTASGVVMLEVAARPIGGLCSRVLRFGENGRVLPLEELLLRHACGLDVSNCRPEAQASGVMMIPIPTRGVYKGVAGECDARAVPHITEVLITAKPDQLLEPLPEGDSYLGFIFARGETSDIVMSALRDAHSRLIFRMDRELPLV